MSSYGSEGQEFRPRPSKFALLCHGLGSTLLAELIWTALQWGIETILAWNSGWQEVLILDLAPLANGTSAFYVSPPLGSPWTHAPELVATAALILASGIVLLWPTRITLASRLFAHLLAIVIAIKGALAMVAEDVTAASEPGARFVAIGLGIAALVVIVIAQRRLLVVLQQFWTLEGVTERLALFAILQLPGLLALGLAYWWSGYLPGSIAAAGAFLVAVVVQLRYARRTIYERVRTHELTGAAIATILMASFGLGASILVFGSPLIPDADRRALSWAPTRGFALQLHEEIFREQLREPESRKAVEPVIRWSKDRPSD